MILRSSWQSFPRRSSRQSSESSVVDVVSVPALQRATHKPEEQKREEEASETADEQGDTQEQGTGENGVQDGEKVRDSKEDGTPTAEDPGETRVPRDTSPEAGLGEREFTLDTPAGTVTTEALTPPTSEAQRAEPEQKEPEAEEGEGDKPEEPEGGGEASQLESLPIAVATAGEPVVLDYDQSSQELVRIMVETFRRYENQQNIKQKIMTQRATFYFGLTFRKPVLVAVAQMTLFCLLTSRVSRESVPLSHSLPLP